jgi:signal peptidase II
MNRASLWRDKLLPALIIPIAILLDQLSKHLTVLYLKPIPTLPLIENVLHLTYRTNTGAAFSIFSAPDQRWIYMTASTVGILAMLAVFCFYRQLTPLMRYALAAIIGGGIGNMIDRIFLGYVVDMIDFRLINFAVFNVADSFVCVGTGVLLLALLLDWRAEERAKREQEGQEPSAEA